MIFRRILITLGALLFFSALGLYLYVLPSQKRLSEEEYASSVYPETIQEVAEYCLQKGYKGWELAEEAQRIVSERFRYSRRNPWDSPEKAFQKGLGYCLQQARALSKVYDYLDIENSLVMAYCSFPGKWVHGLYEPPAEGRHTWLRVTIQGETRDVCPGNPLNYPGRLHFEILSEVKPLHSFFIPFAHLGSVVLNSSRDRRAIMENNISAGEE